MKRLGFFARIWEFILDIFLEEYELTIWFHKETTVNEHGLKSVSYSEPKVFLLKRLYKINHKCVKGKDIQGNPLNICTKEDFNYNLRKLR